MNNATNSLPPSHMHSQHNSPGFSGLSSGVRDVKDLSEPSKARQEPSNR